MASLIILVIFGFIALGALIYVVTIYNGLVTVKNNVAKSWSNIDVLLKQRYDEIPKLVKVCDEYMKYEKDTLQKITEARNLLGQAQSVHEKAEADRSLAGALKSLFAVAENYPDLKANNSFQQLQGRISAIENDIADRREFYNESVNVYNIRIEMLPDVIVARMLGYQPSELFKATATEKQDVEINFTANK